MCRHEAERSCRLVVAAARDEDRAEPVECRPAAVPVDVGKERVTGATGAVRGESALVRGRRQLAGGELGSGAAVAQCMEERAVRILGPVREVTREPVEDDRGSSLDDRERVAPEPERQPEGDCRHGQRVQPLARRVMVLPGHPDHDRVEGLLEPDRAPRDPPEESLRVSDRWRSGEGGDDRQLSREVLEDLAAQTSWKEREPTQRRGDEVTKRSLLVGVAAEATEESRRIEH